MKYFQELTLLPGYEIPLHFIWSKVYQQLHLAFVEQMDENENVQLGVSFPEYIAEEKSFSLGMKARIFAEEEENLKRLDLARFLLRLTDYVHLTGIRSVPINIKGYSLYSRIHKESSQRQKARRYAKRHNLSYEEAIKLFPGDKNFFPYPYVQLKSLTNQQNFKLFIKRTKMEKPILGSFGTYGLSDFSTVPEF